jgi:Cu/Ag efflux protein CusF
MPILIVLALMCGTVAPALAADSSQPAANNAIKGDVLYWEEGELVVKELSGRQVRLRVTPQTKIVGVVSRLKTGDKIEAQVNSDGGAQSIQLQVPDAAPGAMPPVVR